MSKKRAHGDFWCKRNTVSQIINKVIFKYIMLLLLCFASSVVLVACVHLYFQNLTQKLEKNAQNTYAKIDIARHLKEEISELHIAFLELTVATRSKLLREQKIQRIREQIHEAEAHIAIINHGGVFEKKLFAAEQTKLAITYLAHQNSNGSLMLNISLSPIFDAIDTISRLLSFRDLYIETNDPKLHPLVSEIRSFNANIFLLFDDTETMITTMILSEYSNLETLKAQNQEEHARYTLLEIIILLLSAIVIVSVIYKILGQIINLYKELENQLYVDALTKLKSRTRLLKDIKEAKNPAIVLIDINSFRTINELYGVDVGNEVLVRFARMLREFAKNRDFKVYRISGDEFVFFKDVARADPVGCANLLDTFFENTKNNQIFIDSLGESLYLDLSVGASFEKDNPLGTADVALNHAKQQHKPYVIFHKELDALQEIAQGALWKKKIIAGIQNDAFLPFFQPIVDKNGTVVKYEALMRFTQQNGKTSYISPVEFLDIACKTRHYNEISQMTLLKSLHVSFDRHIDVSLNLNYQDILNRPLHALLKEQIIEMGIAEHIVFEIVESQNIQNYGLLKAFMAEFRVLGVRFAIDDFGTGFSNFSHIIELSPDYIKIDGSLIKNLDTDKTSYELVKAIVFFSKELGIQTVAEYVHSEEVFNAALGLDIDLFQGYYFGAPQREI